MRTIERQDGKELWQYNHDVVVKAVPIEYFDSDDVWNYVEQRKNFLWWKNRTEELCREFDISKFDPIYYCKRCRRLEDGTHRLVIAKMKHMQYVDVRIGKICYKKWKINKPILGENSDIEPMFLSFMRESGWGLKPKDHDWFDACVEEKWAKFGNLVDFYGKRILDIGCQVGYTPLEAWSRGAVVAIGLDIRGPVLDVARAIKKKLNIEDVDFQLGDFLEMDYSHRDFDIVSCMGLLHYFPMAIYPGVLRKLCFICKETLILELRVVEDDHPRLIDIKGQTLPTIAWLDEALKSFGFEPFRKFRQGDKRALWITRRNQ